MMFVKPEAPGEPSAAGTPPVVSELVDAPSISHQPQRLARRGA